MDGLASATRPGRPSICGCRLLGRGRGDDDERVARHRLGVFTAQTRPLLDHYRRRGRLVVVDAVGPPDVVSERILAALAKREDAGIPPPPGRCGNGGLVSEEGR